MHSFALTKIGVQYVMIFLMSLSIKNYSQNTINKIIKNFAYLEDNTTTANLTFELDLKIEPNLDQLDLQARIFSINYKTHGYINFYKSLRIRDDQVETALYEMYVYSYVKSLYNGLFFHNLSEDSNLGLAFQGHALFFQAIKAASLSEMRDDVYLRYNLNLGSPKYKQALLARILSRFSFLKSFINESLDNVGTTPFYVRYIETYFSYITQDYYSNEYFKQGVDSKNSDNNFPNGRLFITKLNMSDSNSILKFNTNPIMNAFTNDSFKEFYFVPVLNGTTMVDNPAVFFSKANFISLRSDGKNNNMIKIRRIYNSILLNSKQRHLVLAEVFTNTGVICRFNSEGNTKYDRIKVPSIDKFIKLIEDHDYTSLLEKISEELWESINNSEEPEIDIYNILLGLFAK